MSLYNTYNNEDLISRAVIAGMLDILNNQIKYNQVWSNKEVEKVEVPWYYNQSGDERFMQDFYTHYADCKFPKPVDGNFDRIPRGVITYTGANIDATRITNRFVQGRYVKETDGHLNSFVSFLYSIPLTIKFDCEMWIDTHTTALKIEQAIREVFYKTKTFYVYYKGMRLGCTAGFSEDILIDKLIEYSFETDNRIKITFTIEAETYQPVFDPTTEMSADNTMKSIGYRIYDHDEKNDGKIEIKSPSSGLTIPKSYPLMIEWNFTRENGVLAKVDAYWLYSNTNEWNIIEKGIENHEYWIWDIPDTFTDFKEPIITWEETSSVKVYRTPSISIIPDLNTKKITSESFMILNEGYFDTTDTSLNDAGYFTTSAGPLEDTSIGIILEMTDDENRKIYTKDNEIFINIKHYKIDPSNPVWVTPDASIIFPGSINYKEIDLHIANSVNNDVFGVIKNLKIV